MQPRDDLVSVGQMLDCMRRATSMVRGLSRAEYDAAETIRLAVVHLVQTVGETARRVSADYREQHPDIPWSSIVAVRSKLVHDYDSIDYDLVWDVVTSEFPKMIGRIEQFLPPEAR